MSHNTLALFLTDSSQIQYIDIIKKEYDYDDVVIITDNNFTIPDYSIVPIFYIKFFKGHIVFLSLADYLNNREYFPVNQVGLAITDDELSKSNIDINKLHLHKVIKL